MLSVWLFVSPNRRRDQKVASMNLSVTFWLNQQSAVFGWRVAVTSRFSVHCQPSFISIQSRLWHCHVVCFSPNATSNKEIFLRQLSNNLCHREPPVMSCICSRLTQNLWPDHRQSARQFVFCLSAAHCRSQQKFTSKSPSRESRWRTTRGSCFSASITRPTASLTVALIPTTTVGACKFKILKSPSRTNTFLPSLRRRRSRRPTTSAIFSASLKPDSRPQL